MLGFAPLASSPLAGSIEVTGSITTAVTGVSATTAVGDVGVAGDASYAVTGVAATMAVGDVGVAGDASLAVTGVAATMAVGDVGVAIGVTTSVTGLEALARLARANVWGKIDPTNPAEYDILQPSQDAAWATVGGTSAVGWVDAVR